MALDSLKWRRFVQRSVKTPLKQEDERLCFFDLPAEIRNMIYSECLTDAKPQVIHEDLRAGIPARFVIAREIDRPHRRYRNDTQLAALNLRSTCTMLHHESDAVFWGGNHFDISQMHWQLEFLQMLGPTARHLQSITLGRFQTQKEMKDGLKLLKQARNLKKLGLHSSCWMNFRTSESMAQALLPLMRSVCKVINGNKRSKIRDILDIAKGYWPNRGTVAETITILEKKLKAV